MVRSTAKYQEDPLQRSARKIEFKTLDGHGLSFSRIVDSQSSRSDPVLLVHGAGVRSNIFSPPHQKSLDQVLVRAGYAVWKLDWRASIEHDP